MTKITYQGQKVSIGIDVHRDTYAVTTVSNGQVIHKTRMPGDPEMLVRYIKRFYIGAKVCTAYEAGFSGFFLHRTLVAAGVESIVVNAGSIEVASRDRVKTDKRDSEKLATQLDIGRLKGIRVPSVQEEAARLVHRTREQLVKRRRALMTQIRMRFYQFGVRVTGRKEALTIKSVERCIKANAQLPKELVDAVQTFVRLWQAVNKEILHYNALIRKSSNEPVHKVYKSLPGVGVITSHTLACELGDLRQFSNERKLFSFVGLTPSEYSSGDHMRKGHISRQGSGRLRGLLVEAAWNATKRDKAFAQRFTKLAARIGKKRAIVATARKLIGIARALFQKDEVYRKMQLAA